MNRKSFLKILDLENGRALLFALRIVGEASSCKHAQECDKINYMAINLVALKRKWEVERVNGRLFTGYNRKGLCDRR